MRTWESRLSMTWIIHSLLSEVRQTIYSTISSSDAMTTVSPFSHLTRRERSTDVNTKRALLLRASHALLLFIASSFLYALQREREREKRFHSHVITATRCSRMCWKRRKRRKEKAHEHYEMRLGIFADDSSFAAHHFGILPCVPIECRPHHTGHLIVVGETTPHDTSETVLFKNTPLTRSETVERRF